ncbi:IS66 family transposase [Sinorhizobium fredii]|uniref:IS66 family transposase n=1 Tax=Rhizobium fredii TaxID=380 RepID=UPI00351105F8
MGRRCSARRCLHLCPGRGGQHAERILPGFSGILQVDGYAGYNRLIAPDRVGPSIQLASCWAHARRKLVAITRTGVAPIAEEGVKRIGELYQIEADLRGLDPEARLGADPAPMRPTFLGYLKRQGCGPETEIYRDVEMSIGRLEGANLKLLAQSGDPNLSLSEQQVQDWAMSTSKELGGCERLIKLHESESWQ